MCCLVCIVNKGTKVSRGTKHTLEGVVRRENGYLVLDTGGGGKWRLEGIWRPNKYLGKAVVIEGVRDGFDLLYVKRIRRNQPLPEK